MKSFGAGQPSFGKGREYGSVQTAVKIIGEYLVMKCNTPPLCSYLAGLGHIIERLQSS